MVKKVCLLQRMIHSLYNSILKESWQLYSDRFFCSYALHQSEDILLEALQNVAEDERMFCLNSLRRGGASAFAKFVYERTRQMILSMTNVEETQLFFRRICVF